MIVESDLIRFPYTPDLTAGGVAYACRELVHRRQQLGTLPIGRMRRIVVETAVELAFRHYIDGLEVPYRVLNAGAFSEPDRYDVALGGHRCILKTNHISDPKRVADIRRDPGVLLGSQAHISVDELSTRSQRLDDILLFAYLLCLAPALRTDTPASDFRDRSDYLIHTLPFEWALPGSWEALEPLALKSECEQPVTVQLGGMDADHSVITTMVELMPRERVIVKDQFFSLAYIHVQDKLTARIGIHSPRRGKAYVIPPSSWNNIWIHGTDIVLAGWLTHDQFRSNSKVPTLKHVAVKYIRPPVKELSLPLRELNPCSPLFRRVKTWAEGRTSGDSR
jgi:hypothetical protein